MTAKAVEFMETYFDEIEPKEFYRRLFGTGNLALFDGAEEFSLHGTIIDYSEGKKKNRHIKVWEDLTAIETVQGVENRAVAMPPVAYIGTRRTNSNARLLFALAIDLDYLTDYGTASLFSQIDKAGVLPRPTFVVCSGRGLHLYFVFPEPIPCYEYNQSRLRRLKTGLTQLVWNAYVTEKWSEPEIESLTQCMRVVGSGTKDGAICRAFETGGTVTTEYLDSFVTAEYQVGRLERRTKGSLEMWKAINPEWYQRRVVEKKPRRYWACHRGLYDNWLHRIQTEAVVNHRYFAVMALAIYAIKSGVSYEELERDALSLVPILDALTVEENNHFTEEDVESALRAYSEKYKTFPRQWIEKLCAISIPPNRRNGRSQRKHLELARLARDQNQRDLGTTWNGRKSKNEEVRLWRKENPTGSKAECKRDTGLSYPTIRKWWKSIEKELPRFEDILSFDVSSLADISEQRRKLVEFLSGLEVGTMERWVAENRESIDELLRIFRKFEKKHNT